MCWGAGDDTNYTNDKMNTSDSNRSNLDVLNVATLPCLNRVVQEEIQKNIEVKGMFKGRS